MFSDHFETACKSNYSRSPHAGCTLRLVMLLSDGITLQDEIAGTFITLIFGCLHYNSTFLSSVVRSAFDNMNSPVGKSVRLCVLKYGRPIGEADYGC